VIIMITYRGKDSALKGTGGWCFINSPEKEKENGSSSMENPKC